MKTILFTILTIFSVACDSPERERDEEKSGISAERNAEQIGQYVVEAFQDSKGNLWFGTLEKGVAKYDGSSLIYLTIDDGLPSNRVVSIIEDSAGILWFGTGSGIAKYDGEAFTNFTESDGLCSNAISCLFLDSKGVLWVGTWGGVCKYDGTHFATLKIPYPEIDAVINLDTKDWVTSIMEDSEGNMWFGRDGYGACKYDGQTFVHFTRKEGLNSNNVQSIKEDRNQHVWIGTRVAEKDNAESRARYGQGGLNKFDGEKMIQFPEIEGLSENDVYTLYIDRQNTLWISSVSKGAYRFENNDFINYRIPASVMSILQDRIGTIWFGTANGLYRMAADGAVVNVTSEGPWN